MQQSAITGGAEPLLYALKQADERLARFNEPRLERVREAIKADVELAQSVAIADLATLTQRLDDAMRLVDVLPLLSRPELRSRAATPQAEVSASSGVDTAQPQNRWDDLTRRWDAWMASVWTEVRGLVRVTPIDQPEAMLIAPNQSFFLRENLKLRLLNARLALLSRQFDTARSDLRDARQALTRYFDGSAASVQQAQDLVQQVAAQARQVAVPRPDASLAAIAAATPRR
jgi:uroporphyrin-3 C-methyltransferase